MRGMKYSKRTLVSRLKVLVAGVALVGLIAGSSIGKPVSTSFGKFFSPNVALANVIRPAVKPSLYQKLTKWAKDTRRYVLGRDTNSSTRFTTSLKIPFGSYDITVVGNVYKNEKDKSGVAFRIRRISDKSTHMDVVKFDQLSDDKKRELQSVKLVAEVNKNFVRIWAVVNGKIEKSSTVLQTFKFDGRQVTTYGKPIYLASAK